MRILTYRKSDRPRAVNRKRHADNAERVKLRVTKGDTDEAREEGALEEWLT